jgi:hypothetical protein
MKLTKKEFIELLDFLSGFGGFTDLGDEPMQEELWGYYLKERRKK